MTIVENRTLITGGVDTHLNFHVAAAVDANGGTLGVETFPVGRRHYGDLTRWLESFGELGKVGVEGTSRDMRRSVAYTGRLRIKGE